MKTAVYVDGYNLYYGRLRGTPNKWLDLRRLLDQILRGQDPATQIEKIVFCTANIKAAYASHGTRSVEAQTTYHHALKHDSITVDASSHVVEKRSLRKYDGSKRPSTDYVDVWQMEEKQTDVKLALGMYRDSVSGAFDQIVLVSGDTDLVPAFEAIKGDAPNITLGLILPRHEVAKRPPPGSLMPLANWVRSHITDDELAKNRFPVNIHRPGMKPLAKPEHW